MPRLLALALLSLPIVGCADSGDPAPRTEPTPPGRAGGVEATATPPVRPGAGLDRILADRGDDGPMLADLHAPRSVTAEPVPNRHVAGQIDTVRTRTYDGLVIEAYEVAGGPTFVQRVTVTGVDYGTASGLAVDEPRADLEAILGPPVEEAGATAVYETGDAAAPTVVEVVYEPDERGRPRAAQITWRPYVD